MLTALLIGLGCMALCLAVLAAPITLTFAVSSREKVTGQVRLSWQARVFQPVSRLSRWTGRGPAKPKPPAPSRPPFLRSDWADMAMAVLKTEGLTGRVFTLMRNLGRTVRLRRLTIQGRIGLGDPADTGRCWGMLCAMAGMMSKARRIILRLEPDFERAVFEVDGHGAIRIVPLRVIAALLRFVFSPPALRAAWMVATWKRQHVKG
jgi:hypothetical protein